jgi:hypothetical protein
MRLVLLVAGATATGALSVGAIQATFPQTAQTFQAVSALGGNLADFPARSLTTRADCAVPVVTVCC